MVDNESRLVGKPTICIGENKGADQLRGNREADQRLCFRFTDSTIYFLNTKFHASSCFLLLHSPVFVGPVQKPHSQFSHEAAHLILPGFERWFDRRTDSGELPGSL